MENPSAPIAQIVGDKLPSVGSGLRGFRDFVWGIPERWSKRYHYHDSPDGEDCFKKLCYLTQLTGASAVGIVHLSYIAKYSTSGIGFLKALPAIVKPAIPIFLMGPTFAGAVCAATLIRGKDGPLNYTIGGLSSGLLVAISHSPMAAINTGFVFAGLACFYKYNHQYQTAHKAEPHPLVVIRDLSPRDNLGESLAKAFAQRRAGLTPRHYEENRVWPISK